MYPAKDETGGVTSGDDRSRVKGKRRTERCRYRDVKDVAVAYLCQLSRRHGHEDPAERDVPCRSTRCLRVNGYSSSSVITQGMAQEPDRDVGLLGFVLPTIICCRRSRLQLLFFVELQPTLPLMKNEVPFNDGIVVKLFELHRCTRRAVQTVSTIDEVQRRLQLLEELRRSGLSCTRVRRFKRQLVAQPL